MDKTTPDHNSPDQATGAPPAALRICPQCERRLHDRYCAHCRTSTVLLSSVQVEPQRGTHAGMILAGQYELQAELGKGGMGTVYRGVQLSVDRPVAVKLITSAIASDLAAIKRFQIEAKITSRLSHPNTIRLYDFGVTDDGLLYLVMELLEGHELSDQIRAHGQLGPRAALTLTEQVLGALREAHEQGVVHRDLKPANIFITAGPDGPVAKVMDFGIAKVVQGDDASKVTKTGMLVGTPAYMSPEQARGAAIDHRSDFYSLGIILYEMLTGRLPFEASTPVSLLLMHVSQQPRALVATRPDLPGLAALQPFLDQLLAKDPAARPADAGVAMAALRALLATLPADPVVAAVGAADQDTVAAMPTPAALRGAAGLPGVAASVVGGAVVPGGGVSANPSTARVAQPGPATRPQAGGGAASYAPPPPPASRPPTGPSLATRPGAAPRPSPQPAVAVAATPAPVHATGAPALQTASAVAAPGAPMTRHEPAAQPSAAQPPTTQPPAKKKGGSAAVLIALAAAALLLLAVGGVGLWWFAGRGAPAEGVSASRVSNATAASAASGGHTAGGASSASAATAPAAAPAAPPAGDAAEAQRAGEAQRGGEAEEGTADASAPAPSGAAAVAERITVISKPDAAEVRVGAQVKGRTPLALNIAAATEVSLHKPGFAVEKLTLTPGDEAVRVVRLKRLKRTKRTNRSGKNKKKTSLKPVSKPAEHKQPAGGDPILDAPTPRALVKGIRGKVAEKLRGVEDKLLGKKRPAPKAGVRVKTANEAKRRYRAGTLSRDDYRANVRRLKLIRADRIRAAKQRYRDGKLDKAGYRALRERIDADYWGPK